MINHITRSSTCNIFDTLSNSKNRKFGFVKTKNYSMFRYIVIKACKRFFFIFAKIYIQTYLTVSNKLKLFWYINRIVRILWVLQSLDGYAIADQGQR